MTTSLVIRGGTVYDGSGAPGIRADVAVNSDRILGIGEIPEATDAVELDASARAVVPGFVNALSHACWTLQVDGSGESELLQGVTTEVFGEAFTLGPSNPEFGALIGASYGPEIATFPRLSQGLDALVSGGVTMNVASSLGGTNLRVLAAGCDDRPLTAAELDMLRRLVAEEMQEGAIGIGTALIYAPGRFADVDELASLCEVVASYDGLYTSHLRSEGDRFLECLGELVEISERSGVRAEVFHLKAAGRANWPKMQQAIHRIAGARAAGMPISASIYPYEAGGTGLAAAIPPWYHDGGPDALAERLRDAGERKRMADDIRSDSDAFENLVLAAGGGAGIMLVADLEEGSIPARGRTLDEVATALGMDEVDALLEIVAREPDTGAMFFVIAPEGIELGLRQPWVSIGSDAVAHPASEPWTDMATHPRTYGTFARILGHYCRELDLFPFPEAIRRMTSLPADTFRLAKRGRIVEGAFADLVVLDPATVADRATYADPHQLAVGVDHVVVNGELVVRDGSVTGARPGRRLRRGVA